MAALLLSRERRGGQEPRLTEIEGLASDWTHQHLLVTWLRVPAEEVKEVVREAVAAFQPQMNLPQMDTPFRQFLTDAREQLSRMETES